MATTSIIGIEVISYNKKAITEMTQIAIDAANAAAAAYTAALKNELQPQIDGQIESWFYNYDPTLLNEPTSLWTTNTEKDRHLGDLFYNSTNGIGYRFSFINDVYTWEIIRDTGVVAALQAAANAQDTADHKKRVFITPQPDTIPPFTPYGPYDVGDLWSQGPTGDLLRCINATSLDGYYSASDWGIASKYTDDTTANNANDTANQALGAAQDAAQQAAIAYGSATTAAGNALSALAIANSKTKNYTNTGIGSDVPTYYNLGDTWTDGKNLYKCIHTNQAGTYVAADWVIATDYISSSVIIKDGVVTAGATTVADINGNIWGGMQGAPGTNLTATVLWLGGPDPTTAPFQVLANGTFYATNGYIGPWEIGQLNGVGFLRKEAGANSAGMVPNDYPFYAGATFNNRSVAKFRVSNSGNMNCTAVTISDLDNQQGKRFELYAGPGSSNTLSMYSSAYNGITMSADPFSGIYLDAIYGSGTNLLKYTRISPGILSMNNYVTSTGLGTFTYNNRFFVDISTPHLSVTMKGVPVWPTNVTGDVNPDHFKFLRVHYLTGEVIIA